MTVPRILATCGGWAGASWGDLAFGPLLRHALDLTGVEGRPRIVFVGTAGGDQRGDEGRELAAAMAAGVDAVHLRLFGRTVLDLAEVVQSADLVWTGGGSVVNLLAVWRAHGLDTVLRAAWESGILLAGTSAGALCWHEGGPTSGFGEVRTITDGLGFIPGSLGVHYDSQAERRPALHAAVASGRLPGGFGLDEGTGVLYEGAGRWTSSPSCPGARCIGSTAAGTGRSKRSCRRGCCDAPIAASRTGDAAKTGRLRAVRPVFVASPVLVTSAGTPVPGRRGSVSEGTRSLWA